MISSLLILKVKVNLLYYTVPVLYNVSFVRRSRSDKKRNVLYMFTNPLEAFSTELYILKLNGFYNPPSSPLTFTRFLLILLGWLFVLLIWISMAIEIYVKRCDLDTIVDILCMFTTQTCYLIKLLFFVSNKKLISRITDILLGDTFSDHDIEDDRHLDDGIAVVKLLGRVFRMLCCCACSLYAVLPFLGRGYLIPIPGYFPFDVERNRVWITGFQAISVGLSALNNSSLDLMTCGMTAIGSAQFEILKGKLRNCATNKVNGAAKRDEEVVEDLQKCVELHNDIIRYVAIIEKIFTYGVLTQFLGSAVVICVVGFQLTVIEPFSIKFMLFAFYFCSMSNQASIYCWFGHEIIFKSRSVIDSCYESCWYEYGTPVKKMLFIIMERAKRPVSVSAGNVFDLSLTTLAAIFRSSYSYFAVLRRLYNK